MLEQIKILCSFYIKRSKLFSINEAPKRAAPLRFGGSGWPRSGPVFKFVKLKTDA